MHILCNSLTTCSIYIWLLEYLEMKTNQVDPIKRIEVEEVVKLSHCAQGNVLFFSAKPGSAGVNIREGTHRLLALAMKGEWPPVDQVLKSIEKAVASGGEDVNTAPLMGVMDPVSGSKNPSTLLSIWNKFQTEV